jgi:hypothetical protein
MPDEAKIHNSALKRMEADPNYRPGNLIVGGGGVGMRKAPKDAGTGEWELIAGEGDLVGECFMRKKKTMSVITEKSNGAGNGASNGVAHKEK